ncbi:MAG: YtxH domain-containing protein [Bacteroidia bacterium]
MSENNNTEKVLLALLAGAVAGLAVGILIAPGKGSETREKIADLAEDLAAKLKNEIKGKGSAEAGDKSE